MLLKCTVTDPRSFIISNPLNKLSEYRCQAANVLWSAVWSLFPARRPAIEMSSSKDSQCSPRLLILTCSRCSAELWRSRGNHASGTPMTRPSLKSTHMLSGSKCTRVALAEKLIPCPLDSVGVDFDDFQQLAKSAGIVAIIVGHPDLRFQPVFRFLMVLFDVDVNRLTRRSFVRIKEKLESR
jgi:hypothetical protein